jgi:transcriptional regulator with XRE-family HTH domain
MPAPGIPTVRRRRLAAELRRLRLQSDQTAEAVGSLLGWSKAKVSRYELAQSGLRPSDVEILLDVYNVHGKRREQLLTLAQEAAEKGWWEAYSDVLGEEYLAFIALEAEAPLVLQWHINVIPGLLQTEQYALDIVSGWRAVSGPIPPAFIDRRVEVRMRRQQILTRDQPLELTVVLDESVLRRQRGDNALMYEQLHRLVEVSGWPNVTLQILPLAGPKSLAADSFTLFQFGSVLETSLHDVVSTENLANYLYVEGETSTYEFRQAFELLAQESLDPEESRELILRTAQELWSLRPRLNQNRHFPARCRVFGPEG